MYRQKKVSNSQGVFKHKYAYRDFLEVGDVEDSAYAAHTIDSVSKDGRCLPERSDVLSPLESIIAVLWPLSRKAYWYPVLCSDLERTGRWFGKGSSRSHCPGCSLYGDGPIEAGCPKHGVVLRRPAFPPRSLSKRVVKVNDWSLSI